MALAAAAPGTNIAVVLLEIGGLLLLLGLLSKLAKRLRTSPVAFYLAVGVLLGLSPIDVQPQVVDVGAAVGVVLLLFFIGLEYTGKELLGTLRHQAGSGVVDAALNVIPAIAIGLLMELEAVAIFALVGIAWASSSGIVARTIEDLGRIGNRETQGVLSVLVIEDVAMAAYLPLLTVLLAGGALAAALGSMAVALAVVALVLFFAVRGASHAERAFGSAAGESLVLMMLGVTLLVAGLAELVQLSAAVGAFLVGIVVSGRLADRTRSTLAPLRDLFAAAFFVFFGLQIELSGLLPEAGWVALLCAAGIASKMLTGWYVAGRAGGRFAAKLRAATVLIPRGEFAIVIASLAVAAGVDARVGPVTAGYVLALALIGSLATRFADPFSRRWLARRSEVAASGSIK